MAQTDVSPKQSPSQARRPVRLLVVEDDPNDLLLLEAMLSQSEIPFEVETAETMAEAVKHLRAGNIDFVLTDLSLPDSHGLKTFDAVHSCAPQVPVIVLSGSYDEELAVHAVEHGAQDYLIKGRIDCPMLVRAIRYAQKRVEADRALADERNLLRNVIDAQPDSIYVKDTEGRYILNNVAHLNSLGVSSAADVIGKTALDFLPPAQAEKADADDMQVIQSGKAILNRQESKADAYGETRWLSVTKVPFRDRTGKIIGVVGLKRNITERKLAEDQIAHYNEVLREKNRQLEDDLRMASEVQQAFLSQQAGDMPRVAAGGALRFYNTYLPTGTVGGDFFHILPLSETTAAVFISDVMGHGVRAALVTALQRALVGELAEHAADPGAFLGHINSALLSILRSTGTPVFVSGFHLFIDVRKECIQYSSAGHPMPIWIRRGRGIVQALPRPKRHGPALGVFDAQEYGTCNEQIAPGDLLLLFTDGLFEVEGRDGVLFDEEKLLALVRARAHLPAQELSAAVISDVKAFSSTGAFSDDVCLVLMEFQTGRDSQA